jgi:hypothetical protein
MRVERVERESLAPQAPGRPNRAVLFHQAVLEGLEDPGGLVIHPVRCARLARLARLDLEDLQGPLGL